jgi:hypothetical protein
MSNSTASREEPPKKHVADPKESKDVKHKDAIGAPALNIFSSDGSFLERFKMLKGEEESKTKNQTALQRLVDAKDCSFAFGLISRFFYRKREWEETLKNRKKTKKTVDATETPSGAAAASSAYIQLMKDAEARDGKDTGSGVRPLVK